MNAQTITRTALVTGASRGIGAAIVDEFRGNGISVIAPSRAELDLLNHTSIDAWIERNGSVEIDILVNNAGINELAEISQIDDQAFARMMAINLGAPLTLAKAFLPGMATRGRGWVVNVSSIWAQVAKSQRGGYAASKAGLIGLTRVMALEYAAHGVVVNAVCPGFVATEMTFENNPPAALNELKGRIPMGRLASPLEIARVVRWLCSEENSYLTGQAIVVDGGYTIV